MVDPRDDKLRLVAGCGHPGYRDGAAASARFRKPVAVDVDNEGHIFVADSGPKSKQGLGLGLG